MAFATIEQAEQAIKAAAGSLGEQKLDVVRIVAEIRHDELWKEAINPETQKKFTGFIPWLKSRAQWLEEAAGMGARQLQRHLKAYLCFVDTLDMPEEFLLKAGEHALILAEVANTGTDLTLRPDDIPNKTGGQLLGEASLKQHFGELMHQLDTNPAWKIKNTKQMVADVKGRLDKPTAEWSINATREDDLVHVDTVSFVFDGKVIEAMIPNPVQAGLFNQFVKSTGATVIGMDIPKHL